MANYNELKTRIKSVEETAKITKAMELVSAVKVRKLVSNFQNRQDYLEGLRDILAVVAKSGAGLDNPLLKPAEETAQSKVLVLVIGTSRGFVGAQLSKLAGAVYRFVEELKADRKRYEIISIKAKTIKALNSLQLHPDLHFAENFEVELDDKVSTLKNLIVSGIKDGKYSKVHLAYTKFLTMGVQEPEVSLFIPFNLEDLKKEQMETNKIYKFDQGASDIVNNLLTEYLEASISAALVSSTTSEYAARMLTMHQATENSKTIASELTLKFNKARQSSITAQIQEITNARLKS
jgi:F-type H+-transporting ATPase subunit gamma